MTKTRRPGSYTELWSRDVEYRRDGHKAMSEAKVLQTRTRSSEEKLRVELSKDGQISTRRTGWLRGGDELRTGKATESWASATSPQCAGYLTV